MDVVAMPRPRSVTIAVAIFCVVLVVHLISGSMMASVTQSVRASANLGVFAYTDVVFGFCINTFLIYMIFRRRNWARIIYLVFVVYNDLLFFMTGIIALIMSPIWGSLYLLVYIAQIIGLVLLFSGSGAAWFKRQVV